MVAAWGVIVGVLLAAAMVYRGETLEESTRQRLGSWLSASPQDLLRRTQGIFIILFDRFYGHDGLSMEELRVQYDGLNVEESAALTRSLMPRIDRWFSDVQGSLNIWESASFA